MASEIFMDMTWQAKMGLDLIPTNVYLSFADKGNGLE